MDIVEGKLKGYYNNHHSLIENAFSINDWSKLIQICNKSNNDLKSETDTNSYYIRITNYTFLTVAYMQLNQPDKESYYAQLMTDEYHYAKNNYFLTQNHMSSLKYLFGNLLGY